MRVSQLDMEAFESAPAGVFDAEEKNIAKRRVARLLKLKMIEPVEQGFYRLADINAICGTGSCNWVGLEERRDWISGGVIGGVSSKRSVCPDCGSDTYYRLENSNLVGGES